VDPDRGDRRRRTQRRPRNAIRPAFYIPYNLKMRMFTQILVRTRVPSYGVAARTNEFGIRMALGARARDVVRMVLSGTFWNVGAGLLSGVLLCVAFDSLATRWVTESSRDPIILAGVTVVLLAVAVIACLVPARRAASIDPMNAVRHD
jgi:hypothetical protein